MASGWLRWLLEKFEFPFEVVYPPSLDAGDLASRYDVLIFPAGAVPPADAGGDRRGMREEGSSGGGLDIARLPEEFRNRIGTVTAEKTIPQLQKFLESGGAILAIGSSTSMGSFAGLPLANHLAERHSDGLDRPLPPEKFYIPGSLVRGRVDTTAPLGYGLGENVDFYFDNSPVFRLEPEAPLTGVRPVAWFDGKQPLRSGWAWGEGYLNQGIAVVEATVGKGKLFLFGPEITFRGQPHGTFKFLFNGIYCGRAESVTLP
jgi:hypothetical protein